MFNLIIGVVWLVAAVFVLIKLPEEDISFWACLILSNIHFVQV
jgi:hypothetical protein